MSRGRRLDAACRAYGVLAVYLFGSRADDGRDLLAGTRSPEAAGSDLDVGLLFRDPGFDPRVLTRLQVELEEIFDPLRVDLTPLQRVDALFQFEAIDGHRVAATDPLAADEHELVVMRRAAELLPIERRLEREAFGVTTA
jgi:predicted nucleotidyltransferase